MAVIGLDVGTTVAKCQVMQGGRVLSSAERGYGLKGGRFESIDLSNLISAVFDVVNKAARQADAEISAICVSTLGESFVCLDKFDKPLNSPMLYADPRGREEAEELDERFGASLPKRTGLKPDGMYSLPKLMYLLRKDGGLRNKIDKIFLIGDYISYLLCGERAADYSLASRTMAFDVFKKQWDDELLSAAGLKAEAFSRPVPTGEVIGRLRPEVKERLGLKGGDVLVAAGPQDQISSAIGAGLNEKGAGVVGLGTVECITPMFGAEAELTAMAEAGYAVVPYIGGDYVTYAFNFTGGALVDWFKSNIAPLPDKESFFDFYGKNLPPYPTGVLCLPHFAGAATPYMDGRAKGAFINLSAQNTAFDLYRAVLEGTSFEMRLNLDRLKSLNAGVNSLKATGGGSKNLDWLRIKADILGVAIEPLINPQAGINGCCMLAAVAAGEFSSLTEAASVCCRCGPAIEPDKSASETYERLYERYVKLYSALKELRI